MTAVRIFGNWSKLTHKKGGKREKSHLSVCAWIYLYRISLGLTSAGFGAFKPPMIGVSVAGTSAILIPSTARSATTGSARFLERAAL